MPDSPGAAPLSERTIIRRILDRLPPAPSALVVGPGDDAAVWTPPRGELQVLTTDALVEGVHFDWRYSSPADVGYRALAVNVSDIAAMGGAPHMALLSLMLPAGTSGERLDGLVDGLLEMAAEARVTLAGGNIASTPGPMTIDVTVVGSVRPRKLLTRSGARPGDAIYVSGAVGMAAAGLDWLRENDGAVPDADMGECVERYRRPSPRARIGALLGRNRAASACMDLSDGLADAVRQVSEASGVGAALDAAAIPIHPAARAWFERRGADPFAASAASDDYELLFTVPKRRRGRLRSVLQHARGVPLTRIGEVTADRSIVIREGERQIPLPPGFEHFS